MTGERKREKRGRKESVRGMRKGKGRGVMERKMGRERERA